MPNRTQTSDFFIKLASGLSSIVDMADMATCLELRYEVYGENAFSRKKSAILFSGSRRPCHASLQNFGTPIHCVTDARFCHFSGKSIED